MKLDIKQDTSIYRRSNYPDYGEQLDALWKLVNSLLDKKKPDPEALAVRDAILGVKTKFPKK